MTPYMSFMIQAYTDLLESFAKSQEPDPELWSSLVCVLGKSFEVDETGTFRPLSSNFGSLKITHHSKTNSVLARRSPQTNLRTPRFPNSHRVKLFHRSRRGGKQGVPLKSSLRSRGSCQRRLRRTRRRKRGRSSEIPQPQNPHADSFRGRQAKDILPQMRDRVVEDEWDEVGWFWDRNVDVHC